MLIALSACAQPPAFTGGIVSTNPCADAMLVRLASPERIAAISHYSHDPAAASIPVESARRFRATAGTAEEVVAMRPDLVLASSFTPPTTRAAFERAGLRTLYLDSPATVAASRAQVEEVAAAVGAPAKGRALLAEMDAALAGVERLPPRRRPGPRAAAPDFSPEGIARRPGPRLSPGWGGKERPTALLFIAGPLANGSGTLLDELLTRAGFRDAAADYGLAYTGTLPAERIVSDPPDIVIAPEADGRVEAMRRRLLPRTPVATFPRALVNCGGPSIAPALERLRAIRAGLS